MSSTTFSPHHLVPDGRAMLSCTCLLPDGWVNVPLPEETYDLDNPAVFLPLLVCMAPYGAVVFSIAARPAFDDGTVQDWAEFLAAQNNLGVERIREARINRMPCILVDATMPSEAGLMRSRSVFLEDGRRLFNIGTLAPDAIWSSVESDFDRLLGAFALDDVHGITAAPLRQMTLESAVDLSAAGDATVGDKPADVRATDDRPLDESPAPPEPMDEPVVPNDRPTQAVDVALADDAASLDPDHEIMGLPCLAVRDLVIDGARLDQAYLARASARDDMALVCRVTADRTNMTRAMNTAEVILDSFHGPLPPDPEFAGQPEWWRTAVMHERADRLEEAEQVILQSVDHIGAYSSVAHLYEGRYARLLRTGQHPEAAMAARARAIHWLYVYASSATSGGEGAALSRERDQRIAALGGEDHHP